MQILECVPNVSEGRDLAKIRQLALYMQQKSAVELLHIDSNEAANRTVFTLIGAPVEILKASYALVEKACEILDMRGHRGVHPFLGAVDVCPFIPVQNVSFAEAKAVAFLLGKQIADRLDLPVYFYEKNAADGPRENLAYIRRGGYKNLAQKLQELPPDLGPEILTEKTARFGAITIGARNFLIAFNINLNTKDQTIAAQIAKHIRASSGGLPGIKAIGWYMDEYQKAQVSCNVTDFHKTPLHIVYETCKEIAAIYKVKVTGSELVGLVPFDALLQAGKYYGLSPDATARAFLQRAVEGLGLNELFPFSIDNRVLEYKAGLQK